MNIFRSRAGATFGVRPFADGHSLPAEPIFSSSPSREKTKGTELLVAQVTLPADATLNGEPIDMAGFYQFEVIDNETGAKTTYFDCRLERRGDEIVFDLNKATLVTLGGNDR